jgi:hypothetical protein
LAWKVIGRIRGIRGVEGIRRIGRRERERERGREKRTMTDYTTELKAASQRAEGDAESNMSSVRP